MRRTVLRGIIVLLVVATVLPFAILASAAKPADSYKIILDTPLYAEADFSAETVLESIPKNEPVEIIGEAIKDGENREWIKIKYNGYYEGYVPYGYLYKSSVYDQYDMQVAKATGNASSSKINVYRFFDENSEIVTTLSDGDRINVVLDNGEYGKFSKIVYGDSYLFVKTENVTTGLTYNQRLAVIISGALILGLLIVGVVAVVIVHRRRRALKSGE